MKKKDSLLSITWTDTHEIHLKYLAISQAPSHWVICILEKKLYCLTVPTYLRILTLAWKPKDIKTEVRYQRSDLRHQRLRDLRQKE